MAPPPVPEKRLKQIATDACDAALGNADGYVHSSTAGWNGTIINNILRSLISETSTPDAPPKYKFAVNSTIMQHSYPPPSSSTASTGTDASTTTSTIAPTAATENAGADDASATGPADSVVGGSAGETGGAAQASKPKAGRRGMHSAAGAYWNNERDGLWSFKYEGAEAKGMDVVVSVMWIGI